MNTYKIYHNHEVSTAYDFVEADYYTIKEGVIEFYKEIGGCPPNGLVVAYTPHSIAKITPLAEKEKV